MPARRRDRTLAGETRRLTRVLSCVTPTPLVRSPLPPSTGLLSYTFPGAFRGDWPHLQGTHPLRLKFLYGFRSDEAHGRDQVLPATYIYELLDENGERLVAYHWHPQGSSQVRWKHIHVRGDTLPMGPDRRGRDPHLPTGWVHLEWVLRQAIEEFGVRPRRADWSAILPPPPVR